MLKFNSIRNRLIIYLLIALIPVFSIIIYTGEGYIRSALYKNALSNARMLAFKAARNIEGLTYGISIKPTEISRLLGYGIISIPNAEKLMRDDVIQSKFIYGMALAFVPKYSPNSNYFCQYYYKRNGKLQSKQLIPPSYYYTKFDWFRVPVGLNKSVWSEPYFDKGGGEVWMSTYSAVIKNKEDKPIGVVTADVSISFLSNIVSKIRILKTGGAFLFTKKGDILAPLGNNASINKSVLSIIDSYDKNNFKKLADTVSGKGNNSHGKIKVGQKEYLIYYTPIKHTNWIIGVTFPKSELFLPVKNMETYIFAVAVFGLLAVILLVIAVSRKVTKDVGTIKEISSKIAKGNFYVDIPANLADESKDVAEALNIMQKSLRKFVKEVEEKAKIENELELAQKIQGSFVPNAFELSVNGINFKGISLWAKQVGGDFYGINRIDDDKVIFYLGDVSGKGIPAVLYVAMIKSMIEVLVGYTHSIKDIVEFLNNYFARITTHNMFATMFMGIVDKKYGVLEFCSAGHTPPIMFKNGVIFTSVLNGNIPIGTFEGFEYKTEQIKLSNIDGILLYSDGITDVQNDNNEQLGEDRVVSIVAKCLLKNENIIEILKTTLQEFMGKQGLYDDTTLLLADKLTEGKISRELLFPVKIHNKYWQLD